MTFNNNFNEFIDFVKFYDQQSSYIMSYNNEKKPIKVFSHCLVKRNQVRLKLSWSSQKNIPKKNNISIPTIFENSLRYRNKIALCFTLSHQWSQLGIDLIQYISNQAANNLFQAEIKFRLKIVNKYIPKSLDFSTIKIDELKLKENNILNYQKNKKKRKRIDLLKK